MSNEFTEVKYVHFVAMGQSSHDDWEDLFHYRVHQNWVGLGQFATIARLMCFCSMHLICTVP